MYTYEKTWTPLKLTTSIINKIALLLDCVYTLHTYAAVRSTAEYSQFPEHLRLIENILARIYAVSVIHNGTPYYTAATHASGQV